MKWLLKNTAEYRIDTEAEVDAFDEEIREDAAKNGYGVMSFSRTLKETKDDEFYIVKVTTSYNVAKDPISGVTLDFNFPANVAVRGI